MDDRLLDAMRQLPRERVVELVLADLHRLDQARARFGADEEPGFLDSFLDAAARAREAAWSALVTEPADAVRHEVVETVHQARSEMVQSVADLRELGADSLREGADVAAHGIQVLTEELADGIAQLGQGLASGVDAYMDEAAPYLVGAGVLLLALAGGAGYLLLTGGGQALLKGAGATLTGAGTAVARVV